MNKSWIKQERLSWEGAAVNESGAFYTPCCFANQSEPWFCGRPLGLSFFTDYQAGVHTSFPLQFLLYFCYFCALWSIRSSSQETDKPTTVESSGSESESNIWSQEPLNSKLMIQVNGRRTSSNKSIVMERPVLTC